MLPLFLLAEKFDYDKLDRETARVSPYISPSSRHVGETLAVSLSSWSKYTLDLRVNLAKLSTRTSLA